MRDAREMGRAKAGRRTAPDRGGLPADGADVGGRVTIGHRPRKRSRTLFSYERGVGGDRAGEQILMSYIFVAL